MKPNDAIQMLDTLQRITGLITQIHYATIESIDVLALKILKKTVFDYNKVEQALRLLSISCAEILMNNIISVLKICIDKMFRVSENKWYNTNVHKAFVAIDEIGPNLETIWTQVQAWRTMQ